VFGALLASMPMVAAAPAAENAPVSVAPAPSVVASTPVAVFAAGQVAPVSMAAKSAAPASGSNRFAIFEYATLILFEHLILIDSLSHPLIVRTAHLRLL
jgi:hypothetical protein